MNFERQKPRERGGVSQYALARSRIISDPDTRERNYTCEDLEEPEAGWRIFQVHGEGGSSSTMQGHTGSVRGLVIFLRILGGSRES